MLDWVTDTGSDVDAMGTRQLKHIGGFVENISPDTDIVTSVNGERLKSVGKLAATLSALDGYCIFNTVTSRCATFFLFLKILLADQLPEMMAE